MTDAGSSITSTPMATLLSTCPAVADFFHQIGVDDLPSHASVAALLDHYSDGHFQHYGLDREAIVDMLDAFVRRMDALKDDQRTRIRAITILGGHDKSGRPEDTRLDLQPGEIVCVVGPTGSGKSRLLADIECLAQGDTPTGRHIVINGKPPDPQHRYSSEHKLVAQLCQNMNFVLDLSVGEFVALHAESRMLSDPQAAVRLVVTCANDLAGEKFSSETSVTQLSGGQSRALMIADTALLSPLPVVLIDEIENAGVDRKKALSLLVKGEKIVLMSTHDPLLALMGTRRVIIENGGIKRVLVTSDEERRHLTTLERWDLGVLRLREVLRAGGRIEGHEWTQFETAITPCNR